jgi:exodeoxyribonuclease V beta subunit
LADVSRSDRLDELGFELPVAGGERPVGSVSTADVAAVMARHLAGSGVLAGYPDRLLDPRLDTTLRGYLTGSLDLVFRRQDAGGEPRWYLADYKTNWLGRSLESLTVGDYAPASIDAEMQKRHYPLQALIYAVALHRYLRWRQPGYRPDRHLGGVLYLFVRGMAGPDTPQVDGSPCGVWSWAVPPVLVTELSDLFDTGRMEEPA